MRESDNMGKRNRNNRASDAQVIKRTKTSPSEPGQLVGVPNEVGPENQILDFQIQQKDRIEKKVDIIVKDLENNCHRSLSIWGTGLGVEKTIAVVEELKRNYLKQGTRYSQETLIKTGDNNEPHLQVVLTLLDATG